MDITSDFKSYHEQVTKSLVDVVKTGGQIANSDLSFHRSNAQVSAPLAQQNTRLLRLTEKLLKAACQDSSVKPPTLQSQDDVDDNWRSIVNVVDDLLEKTDVSLDEFTGAIKRMSPAPQDGAQTPTREHAAAPRLSYSRSQFRKITRKPQEHFHRKVDNLSAGSFKPLLVEKPHAIKSLEDSLGDAPDQCNHPYADEISQYQYPQHVYEPSPPIMYPPPEQTPVILVETEHAVHEMLQELKTAKEIAVDLEHHEYRSYYGMVSLMQISTRNKDWIVDTLLPWREKLQVLNEVFADPNILKVFHGSSMDMIWLQRDLGLYVVGLFDTYYACEALQFPGRGLKYLLQRFANFEAQKQYQMADWRLRPLPEELVEYARSDTHYLLYIYDCLRNLLIEASTSQANLVDHVLQGSKKEALQTYVRFVYNRDSGRGPSGWYNTFTDSANHFTKEQFAVFRALHEWRDKKARAEDEGLAYIFSNKVLWTLAEYMPTYQTKLYTTLRPMPSMIQQNAKEILNIIQNAKKESLDDPLPYEFLRENQEKYGIPHNRWRKLREEKVQSHHTGLGATLQQLTHNGDMSSAATPNSEPLPPSVDRSQQSVLWGSVTNAPYHIALETQAALDALEAILPLPKLSPTSFAETNSHHQQASIQENVMLSDPVSVQATSTKDEVTDVFTLRQQSRKRKAEAVEENEDTEVFYTPATTAPGPGVTNGETSSPTQGAMELHVHSNPEHEAKRLAKQKKKAEKRALKAAKDADATAKAYNMVPLDYNAADTLIDRDPRERSLPTDRGQKTKKGARNDNGKPMNPFAKALDTGTGAKRNRLGKELGGRSMTFQ